MTKMKNKIKVILFLLAGIVLLNSCLKDKADYWAADVKGKSYATVLVPTLQTMGVNPVPDTVNFSFMINIAADVPPAQDVTVTMKVDPDAVTAYATRTGKKYLPFPNVIILNPTVVIPKGTRTSTINCKVWGADKLSACDNFIAAVSIDNVSGGIAIASNMKTNLMSLPISNPYAADYAVVGYRVHPTSGVFTVAAGTVETLSTIDCKTVIKHLMGDYPYDVTIQVTTNTIVVSGITCYKVITHVFDPATGDIVSSGDGMETSFTGNLAYPPLPVTNDVNYYDPIAKKFVLNYYYNSAAPRIAYEVLTRQ
jgi:hypothetical protein